MRIDILQQPIARQSQVMLSTTEIYILDHLSEKSDIRPKDEQKKDEQHSQDKNFRLII